MKFEANEVAVHIGNKKYRAGDLVLVVEVGPWAAGEKSIEVLGEIHTCKVPADYVIEHLAGTAAQRFRSFTIESHLKKLNDPDGIVLGAKKLEVVS